MCRWIGAPPLSEVRGCGAGGVSWSGMSENVLGQWA